MRKATLEGVECRRESPTIGLGWVLQRLFSTFPDGWPGFGLLLLRLGLGLRVIYIVTVSVSGKPSEPITLAQGLIAVAGGIILIAGLWTPIIGTLLALDEFWIALSLYLSHQADIVIPIFLAALSASVAMLGPGAWSIDARLFGSSFAFKKQDGWEPTAEPKTLTGAVQIQMGEVKHAAQEVDELGVTQAPLDLDLSEPEDACPPVEGLGLEHPGVARPRFRLAAKRHPFGLRGLRAGIGDLRSLARSMTVWARRGPGLLRADERGPARGEADAAQRQRGGKRGIVEVKE